MGTPDADEGMETVATREWVIRDVDPDGVLVERVPGGGSARLAPGLLPDDVSEGDRFRVVAQVDRRGPVGDGGAPADRPGPSGAGADAPPFEVPAAMEEALRNLS